MLADKGIIGQLKQVRQTVTERTSDLVVTAIGFLGVPYRRIGDHSCFGGAVGDGCRPAGPLKLAEPPSHVASKIPWTMRTRPS